MYVFTLYLKKKFHQFHKYYLAIKNNINMYMNLLRKCVLSDYLYYLL